MAAGLGYKEFSTGDVLTAADANGYLASQVVMVFASAAARTSAIASPQEGMVSYLKDTNSTEYYSGSAWVAIGGGSSGALVYITQSSFSASSAVNVNNCFTSTYRNYKIVLNIDSASTDSGAVYIKMRASGTDSSASYYWYGLEPNSAGDTLYTNRGNNVSTGGGTGYQGANGSSASIEVFDPQLASFTHYTSQFASSATSYPAVVGFASGTHAVSTSYDGFTLIPQAGNITGIVRVYGYVNS